jgi:hypothetical protein
MKSDEIKRTNSVTLSYKLGACTPLDPNFKAGSGSLTQNNADPDPVPKSGTDPATPTLISKSDKILHILHKQITVRLL